MGRGRAKAKQTKVARELKYFSPDTDLSALERELHSSARGGMRYPVHDDLDEADEHDGLEEDDDSGTWASGQR
jgi:hypothetical protein